MSRQFPLPIGPVCSKFCSPSAVSADAAFPAKGKILQQVTSSEYTVSLPVLHDVSKRQRSEMSCNASVLVVVRKKLKNALLLGLVCWLCSICWLPLVCRSCSLALARRV